MQFVGRADKAKSRKSRRVLLNYYEADTYYPHSLSMYKEPPSYDITLQEFEAYAFERVKVLYYLDSLASLYSKNSQEYAQKLTEFLKKNYQGFLLTNHVERDPTKEEIEWRRRDHISHFILRLAYCRSDELRHWFLEKELDLFKYRFGRETLSSSQAFLKLNNFTYNPISEQEKQDNAKDLGSVTQDLSRRDVDSIPFYKVPFTEVLNLVFTRKVFLSQGFAYVPQKEFIYIISTRFREGLSKSLTLTFRALPQLEEKDRILPILRAFSKEAVATGYDANKNKGKIDIDNLDELAKISSPLCMRQLHTQLKEVHHLRYFGRQQYGLYLKGIGVTLEDAMKFWRREFTKAMDPDKFVKQYSYNIRHSYGKEGKRANYTPYNCMAIITKNAPSGQEHHGCPFKHSSENVLRQRLGAYRTPKEAIDEICELVKKHHYQIACQKYFAVTHGLDDHTSFPVTHPNAYFEESQRILNGGEKPGMKSDKSNSSAATGSKFVPQWSQSPAPKKKEEAAPKDDAAPMEAPTDAAPMEASTDAAPMEAPADAAPMDAADWDDDSAIELAMMDCAE